MKKYIKLFIVGILAFSLFACTIHTHVVGSGPSTGLTISARQYYILWGLVPLGKGADTNAMAGDAINYAIETKSGGPDILIGIAANLIIPTTISSRTVTVTK